MWVGMDRRRFPRAEYPCLITLRKSTPPVQGILTHTENIGVGGVRAIVWKKIEAMTEVDLEIDLKDALPNVASRGQVSWVKEIRLARKGAPPSYNIGIQFINLKEEDRRRIWNAVVHLKRQ